MKIGQMWSRMSENAKSIIKILSLYLGTTGIFLCVFFWFSYAKEVRHLVAQQVSELREISLEVYEILHNNKDDVKAGLAQIQSEISTPLRIYNKKSVVIYDTLQVELTQSEIEEGFAMRGDYVIIEPSMHEKIPKAHKSKKNLVSKYRDNARYKIFIQDTSLESQMFFLRLKMIAYFLLSLFGVGVVAYFLVKLSLKPMQQRINALNAFIKDSTHEINTPLSIILMSIETLPLDNLTPAQSQKIERIKLASKSLSHIYKILVAYNFPHSINHKCENLALHILLQERLEYFSPFFEQKALQLQSTITPSYIFASAEKMSCVLDNLLSNAIKYNKKGGEIDISLKEGVLSISDSGCGMADSDKERIFERYVRCNDYQGGFGIGLTLIKRICDEYGINIEVQSEQGKGSCFTLIWKQEGRK
ncbi:sensor histidine kinase [Helicobacter labetoulli]|uniref:sensor histidine kinase n=2 Tax=Helicobacter labetoulli TaxID=2315333 RepID=UPI0039EB8E71